MKKTNKDFDCVEMMHEGALRIHEELKGKTRDEQLAYWQQRNEESSKKHPQLRKLGHTKTVAK
jgi:hypothetical protein